MEPNSSVNVPPIRRAEAVGGAGADLAHNNPDAPLLILLGLSFFAMVALPTAAAIVLMMARQSAEPRHEPVSVTFRTLSFFLGAFGLWGFALFVWGCTQFAISKGLHWALGLLALPAGLSLIFLAALGNPLWGLLAVLGLGGFAVPYALPEDSMAVLGQTKFSLARRGATWFSAFGIFIGATLAYANSFTGLMTLDNKYIIEEYYHTLLRMDPNLDPFSWKMIGYIFQNDYWWPKGISGLYRPLATLSYWLNYVWGKNGLDPFEFHIVNFAMHWLAAFLGFLLVRKLVGRVWVAFFTALLFVTHPIATESVSNIIGRADIASAIAVFAGLLLYIKSTEVRDWKLSPWFWLVVATQFSICSVLLFKFMPTPFALVLDIALLVFGAAITWLFGRDDSGLDALVYLPILLGIELVCALAAIGVAQAADHVPSGGNWLDAHNAQMHVSVVTPGAGIPAGGGVNLNLDVAATDPAKGVLSYAWRVNGPGLVEFSRNGDSASDSTQLAIVPTDPTPDGQTVPFQVMCDVSNAAGLHSYSMVEVQITNTKGHVSVAVVPAQAPPSSPPTAQAAPPAIVTAASAAQPWYSGVYFSIMGVVAVLSAIVIQALGCGLIYGARVLGWVRLPWLMGMMAILTFGLFFKESAIALVAVVIVWDVVYRWSLDDLREALPSLTVFCGIAAIGLLICIIRPRFGALGLSEGLIPILWLFLGLSLLAAIGLAITWGTWGEGKLDEQNGKPWLKYFLAYLLMIPPIIGWVAARGYVFHNSSPPETPFLDNPIRGLSFFCSRMCACNVYLRLTWLVICPIKLSSDYSFNQISMVPAQITAAQAKDMDFAATMTLAPTEWAVSVAGLFAVLLTLALIVFTFRKHKAICFLMLFYLVVYLPTSNWLVIIGSIMAERFMYLPLIGFVGALVIGVEALVRKLVNQPQPLGQETAPRLSSPRTILAYSLIGVLAIAYAARAANRNDAWYSDITLWTAAAKDSPVSFRSYQSKAFALFEQYTDRLQKGVYNVNPSTPKVANGATQQFTATAVDSTGAPVSNQPAITWAVLPGGAGGTIDARTGLYRAPASGSGSDAVVASCPGHAATATVTISGSAVFHLVIRPGENAPGMGGQLFVADAVDSNGVRLASQPQVTWSVADGGAGGTINPATGIFIPAGAGVDTIVAVSAGHAATATLSQGNADFRLVIGPQMQQDDIDEIYQCAENARPIVDVLMNRQNSSRLYLHLGMYYSTKGEALCPKLPDGNMQTTPEAEVWFRKAEAVLQQGVAIDRTFNVINRKKERGRAIKSEAEITDVGLPPIYFYLGNVYAHLSDWKRARAAFAYMQHLDPSDAESYTRLASVDLAMHNDEKAASEMLEAEMLNQNLKQLWPVINQTLSRINTTGQPAMTQQPDGRIQIHTEIPVVKQVVCSTYQDLVTAFILARRPEFARKFATTASLPREQGGWGFPQSIFDDLFNTLDPNVDSPTPPDPYQPVDKPAEQMSDPEPTTMK